MRLRGPSTRLTKPMLKSPLIPLYVSHREENPIVLNITLHIPPQNLVAKEAFQCQDLNLLDVQGMPVGASTPAKGDGSEEKDDGKRKRHAADCWSSKAPKVLLNAQ